MRNKILIVSGSLLIALGVFQVLGYFLNINFWAVFFALVLIAVGVVILLRPNLSIFKPNTKIRPLYELDRRTRWQAQDEEIWMFVGDIYLDLSRAEIPPGETLMRVYGFIGEVNILTSEPGALSVSTSGFLNQTNIFGKKQEVFFTPVNYSNEDYAAHESRFRIEFIGFVVELNLEKVDPS
jgi:predicted membrane protein